MDTAKVKREIRGWAITIAAVVAFRAFLYEAVYIPSGSMIPTLQIGDYVVVEKWAYGARLPFTPAAQASWSSPKRGDIVVFLAPPGNPRDEDLIKRVVGVAGDTVEIRDGHLVLNGTLEDIWLLRAPERGHQKADKEDQRTNHGIGNVWVGCPQSFHATAEAPPLTMMGGPMSTP